MPPAVRTTQPGPKPPAPGATPNASVFAAAKNAETAVLSRGGTVTAAIAAGAAAARKAAPGLTATQASAIAKQVLLQITGLDTQGGLRSAASAGATGAVNAVTDKLPSWLDDILKVVLPILKVGAGGAGLLVSGVALVYIAGRNVGADKAVKTAINPSRALTKKVSRTVAPERHEARRIAKTTRKTERTERARSRVVTETTKRGGARVRVSSRREAANARAEGAEYRASVGQRSRERLSALRAERARRAKAPRLHSGSRS